MLLTSKNANKLLKQLQEELISIEKKENNSKTFLAATSEDPEKIRPEYDYSDMQAKQKEIENKIVKLKHAINMFNVSTIVPEFNKTIDEMLIYIPQLSARKAKLAIMKDTPKMERVNNYPRNTSIIDYSYINYDLDEVSKDYLNVQEELTKAQIAIDKLNVSKTFEVEI